MGKLKAHVFEKGDMTYIVSPVSPVTPGQNDIDEFAFAEQVKRMAPNEHLMWLRGQYVEADRPNANGQMWREGELAIKSLTPMFMPVTVMHDPRTAVGLIADTALRTPAADQVARARIDTTMGIWSHRFPEIAEEVDINYRAGVLMQSMECRAPNYSCEECGRVFPKLPDGAERSEWCDHLTGVAGERAGRILENVVFTGTGLIFGTRGARGAYDEAHLDVFQEEVAEFHAKAHTDTKRKTSRRKPKMDEISIERTEYDALKARPTAEQLQAAETARDTAEQEKADAIKASEEAEADKVKAEQERDALQKKVDEAEEAERKATLSSDRLKALGKDFKAKLGEKTSERLQTQAGEMSDDDWQARLDELSELLGVAPDAGGEGEPETAAAGGEPEFSAEETARAGVGRINGDGGSQAPDTKRASVVGGLFKKTTGTESK